MRIEKKLPLLPCDLLIFLIKFLYFFGEKDFIEFKSAISSSFLIPLNIL